MAQYNSGRRKLPAGEKRVFFRTSLQEKFLKEFDVAIENMRAASPFASIDRTTIIEALILEFLKVQKENAAQE